MKKRNMLTFGLLLCVFAFLSIADAAERKAIQIGDYWAIVMNNTFVGEGSVPDHGQMAHVGHLRWPIPAFQNEGWYMGEADWVDEAGETWPVKLTGAAPVTANELEVTMPIPVEEGSDLLIRRYWAQEPPTIDVDGVPISTPFELLDGEVFNAPDKIPGTADVMVESKLNTDLGVTIHQKVLAWDEDDYNNFVIHDWTFTNTGNIDTDPEVELPNQVLDDLYYLRAARLELWNSDYWYSGRGEFEEDSLRIRFAYPGDLFGGRDLTGNTPQHGGGDPMPGWLWNAHSVGEAILHVDTSPTDPTNDPNQPFMTATENSDLLWIRNDPSATGPDAWEKVYTVMSEGWGWRGNVPEMDGSRYPGKTLRPGKHMVRMEDLGAERGAMDIYDLEWVTYGASYFWSAGPYTLNPGESIRIVFANGYGTMDPIKIWEVGEAWSAGTAGDNPPPGMTWDAANNQGDVDNMTGIYDAFPEVYNNNKNDWAKDAWVFTGIDSLMKNMSIAQWINDNNYDVPSAPPAPSISVSSLPDEILVEWDGTQSEAVSDFAGYRLYRSEAHYYEGYIYDTREKVHGDWEMIAEFGPGETSYRDTDVQRGVAYFYYVTAVDDGSDPPGWSGQSKVMESGKWMNITTQAAHLTRPAGSSLEDIRIVPNPYNISAAELQFPGEPDKIMFLNLPPECTIRIFTESGDLVKTLEHTDGSGDEPWGRLVTRHMTSSDDQIVVSGIYIAHIETPDGDSIYKKFVIVR
ncbi:MAG: fibronectin type III domain-containing protein [Candidatus Marinimicrobia bacterium]|nr:fibronectin type III domain-containing protein [Candidatus Neomarinimicrobiota bacterium]MCF7880238.1 fibronectin type III domain-containing protein [Candidatus Neomarinimicrobiota bacterium]